MIKNVHVVLDIQVETENIDSAMKEFSENLSSSDLISKYGVLVGGKVRLYITQNDKEYISTDSEGKKTKIA